MKPITHPQLQSFQKIYLFNRGKKEKKKEEQTFLISNLKNAQNCKLLTLC